MVAPTLGPVADSTDLGGLAKSSWGPARLSTPAKVVVAESIDLAPVLQA